MVTMVEMVVVRIQAGKVYNKLGSMVEGPTLNSLNSMKMMSMVGYSGVGGSLKLTMFKEG